MAGMLVPTNMARARAVALNRTTCLVLIFLLRVGKERPMVGIAVRSGEVAGGVIATDLMSIMFMAPRMHLASHRQVNPWRRTPEVRRVLLTRNGRRTQHDHA
jgi:hypothetical protein